MTVRSDDPIHSFVTGAWLYYVGIAVLGFCLQVMSGRRA